MKIACTDQEIQKILSSNYYKIPRFQRPYSWDRENIEDFWRDVTSKKPGNHFIGSMVVYIKGNYRYIIDGQQRLTTITVFLSVLREKFTELGFENQAKGIQAFIERKNLDNDSEFVVQTWTSYPFFQKNIQSIEKSKEDIPPGEEEIALKNAYKTLTDLLNQNILEVPQQTTDGIKKHLELIRRSLLSLKIIYVEVDNEDDAYTIFETLNTRGKDLTTSDLLKNHLAKLWKSKNTGNDLVQISWQKIRDNIDKTDSQDNSIDTFIYHYWLATRELTTEKEIFKKAKALVQTKDDASSFIQELIEYSEIYSHLFSPNTRFWKREEFSIKRSLEALNSFRVRQPLPMLLALLGGLSDGSIKRKEVERAFHAIELFHFAFTALTSQRSSGGISHMYASHARELSNATTAADKKKTITGLITKLKDRLPSRNVFKGKFLELKYSESHPKDKRTVQYILRYLYDQQNPGAVVDHDQMSIEHIEPQSSKTINEDSIANIGNLWLLSVTQNNSFGNQSVNTKIPAYKAIGVILDPILNSATTTWDDDNISRRAKYLEEQMWGIVNNIKIANRVG